mgnify:CR=1 FL=1
METARCTQDDSIYSANQFANLSRQDLSERRQNLICPACDGPAFFRRQTQNGRDACFGARPHADGCSLKAAQAKASAQADAYADLLNPAKRIVVDFDFGSPEQPERPIHSGESQRARTQKNEPFSSGFSVNTATHIQMRPLLRLLTCTPQFRTSPQIVDIDGIGSTRACDFFIPFGAITAQHRNAFMGIYGKIVSAQYVQEYNSVWLNSGGCTEPSVCVPVELVSLLLHRFQMGDIAEFANTNVLVFAEVRISQHGKKYMVLENPLYFIVDFARDQ